MSDEEYSTVLGNDVPTTNRTVRMIRKPARQYDYNFSTEENCNFSMAASVNGNVPINYEEAILSADSENWQAAKQKNSVVLRKTKL